MSEPRVGDRVIIYPEGCLPSPAVVTAVDDGKVTAVRRTGGWVVLGAPGEYTVENEETGTMAEACLMLAPADYAFMAGEFADPA